MASVDHEPMVKAYQALFDGLIDEVRIWNDKRTSTEISNNYQTQLNGNEAGLVAYWMLNNNAEDKGESTVLVVIAGEMNININRRTFL